MDINIALKKLENSQHFKQWKQKNKATYLSYIFKIPQEMQKDDCQMGFYDHKKDKITTFVLSDGAVNMREEEDVFKHDEMDVKEIELGKIKLDFDSIIFRANEFQQRNFPKDRSIKTIAILQNLPSLGNIWNITYVTETFNTLNMKIDASNGKILEHNLTSVFEFRAK